MRGIHVDAGGMMPNSIPTIGAAAAKLQAVARRGLPSLRNVVFSWFDYWPARSLRGHWLADIPVYCISLTRAKKRRAVIVSQARRLGLKKLELVDAVDASTLSYDQLAADGLYDHAESLRWHAKGLTINEIACSLSHVACYRRIAAADAPWALVIEDDALFRCSRVRRLRLSDIPDWADIAFLNAFFERTPPAGSLGGGWFEDTSYGGSAAAYLLRPHTAHALMHAALPVIHAADGLLGRALQWSGARPHEFRQRGCTLQLRTVMAYPEAVTNGSTEHYYRSSLR